MVSGRAHLDSGEDFGFSNTGKHRREGDQHVVTFQDLKIELRVSRVSFGDAVRGWLEVRSDWPQDRARLFRGEWNMSGPRARGEMIKHLAEAGKVQIDWQHVLAEAYDAVMDALDEGEPVLRVSEIERKGGSKFRIQPIAFDQMPVIWFGKGGSGKSLLALAAAIGLHGDMDTLGLPLLSGPVLICDWEMDAATCREQVELLCRGFECAIPDIHYRQCVAPLHAEAEAIGRYIDREHIQIVIIDSLGLACGGDKNAQETATRMFAAMRQWGVTVICIDHIAKDEKTNTPYGSVYFENAVRATWRVRGHTAEGSNEHYLSMKIEKQNLGRFAPVSYRFTFLPDSEQPESIKVERIDASNLPKELMADKLGNKAAIRDAFKEARKALTATDLAELTSIPVSVVRTRLYEMEKAREVVKVIIDKAANKWAMRAKDEDVG